MKEQWKPCFHGRYEVSNMGRVRRLTGGCGARSGRVISQQDNGIGYYSVALHNRPVMKRAYVHRLVAEAFIGPCPKGLEVNHIDGDKSNNADSNLEYVTSSENKRHAFCLGLNPGRTSIPEATIDDIRSRFSQGQGGKHIAKETGVSETHCSRIKHNTTRIRRTK